jgi:hypothetical protein
MTIAICIYYDNGHVHVIQILLGRLHAFGAGRDKGKASLTVSRLFHINISKLEKHKKSSMSILTFVTFRSCRVDRRFVVDAFGDCGSLLEVARLATLDFRARDGTKYPHCCPCSVRHVRTNGVQCWFVCQDKLDTHR